MAYEKTGLILAVIGTVAGVAALIQAHYINQPEKNLVSKDSRFYCELQSAPDRGGSIWTVMYRYNNTAKPWLRMVRSMGDNWDIRQRCDEIATRLNIFIQDGLVSFDYRSDPQTPAQYVLCAKTKLSSDNCPLVLTLLPDDNPYNALREVAGALLPGSLPSYQCNNFENCPPAQPVSIDLESQLAVQN